MMSTCETAANTATRVRRRGDLSAHRVHYRGHSFWNVGDPLSRRFYQLREEEYFVLNQLDGTTSLEHLQEKFQKRFAPRRIELRQLNAFLGMLHRESLVVADTHEQGQRLFERRQRLRKRLRWQRATNLLAVRFRGIDPEPILSAVYPAVRWLFSPALFAIGVAWVLASACWALLHWPEIAARLPTVTSFVQLHNILALGLVLAVVKILHELAHGLTCRHFGGRCRELGVMLLVFTPCLYCNVSDAWMLDSKWKRIAISAAGIWVELVLATIGMCVWWFSEPGVINTIALNLMIVCSLGTMLVNGNPLLRYDGYFVLADWLEVPNLSEQANATVRRSFYSLFGTEVDDSPLATDLHPGLLTAYAVLAFLYRCLMIGVILFGVYAFLSTHRLQVLGQILVAIVVAGMIAGPVRQGWTALLSPARRIDPIRGAIAALILAATCLTLLFTPFPSHVSAPAIIRPAAREAIYVRKAGTLKQSALNAQRVTKGQVVAELEDLELESQIASLRGERDVARLRAMTMEREMPHDPLASARLVNARDMVSDLDTRLAKRLEEKKHLTLRASCSGIVIPPRQIQSKSADVDLETWSGSPLDQSNLGGFLESGTHICWVSSSDKLEAVLIVGQDDIHLVALGQKVSVRTRMYPGVEMPGTVSDVSQSTLSAVPPELIAARLLEAEQDGEAFATSRPSYQVTVALIDAATRLPSNSVARAHVSVGRRSLASRLYALAMRTFP